MASGETHGETEKKTGSEHSGLESDFKKGEEHTLSVVNERIHRGNNPNALVDRKSGNNWLHYAAEYNFKDVAAKLLDHGIDGLAKNKHQKTALEIAIDKKFVEISAIIARRLKPLALRELSTRICSNVGGVAKGVETKNTNSDGSEEETKIIDKLIESESDFTEVINHPAVRLLIDSKWTKWARNRFMLNVCVYLLSLFSLTFSVAVAATTDDVKTYNTGLQYTRAFFEVLSYGTVVKALFLEISQVKKHGFDYYKIRFNCLEIVTALILVSVLPVRYISMHVHWYIFGLGYTLWVMKIFKYAVVFSKTGAYIESLRRIFWKDLIPFSSLFCIVNLAFGGTFLLVLKGDDSLGTHAETSSLYGIWYVGLRTLIEAQSVVEYTGEEGYRPIGTVVMLGFMSFTIVVLLNILIAQISDTYKNVQIDAWKSVAVNRLSIITRLERNRSHFPFCGNLFKSPREYEERIEDKAFNKKKMAKKNMQPMDLFKSELTEIRNKLVKNDLKVQTVKTRLHGLEIRLDGIQKTLRSIQDQMSDEVHM